ncbi:immunoglobulin-binding protein 1 isoform X2 [Ctenocephalides felis]|uniref:immunoglobulin-binding protein 1 isoform X2 n=1 Tax=Ctenocephalides felis TaxID=7515 RepID=UPI000E6E2B85|nr:immunoglobulin-binding protein 1 isoform X2 [Ctenocephalides felis]
MATCAAEISDETNLSDMFEEAFALFNGFDNCSDPMNETSFQAKVKRCMRLFEDTTRLVSAADIFSTNERFDELSTEHLRYLLLPAFLGELSLKLCGGNRSEIVDVADIYFRDFLKRCSDYGLSGTEATATSISIDSGSGQHAHLATMIGSRNAKLQKFREQKELESRLKILQEYMNFETVDEDTRREYYVTIIKTYVIKAKDELDSLSMEKQILEHMKKAFEEDTESKSSQTRRKVSPCKILKPVIITKDELQKAVYGTGYPSLPTYTVQEFYDQRVRDGVFPDPNQSSVINNPKSLHQIKDEDREAAQLNIDEEKDVLEDSDDVNALNRARAMDEYKDEHRRGWGNRYNRS